MMSRLYRNSFQIQQGNVVMRVFGGKHTAEITFDECDNTKISSVKWGLMEVGKDGAKTLTPYTVVNRKSIPLGRWLLGIKDNNKKVEHIDRNNMNFKRDNLHVVDKEGLKNKIPVKGKKEPTGVFLVRQANGNETGYKVEQKTGGNRKFRYFSKFKYGSMEVALEEARKYREKLLKNQMKGR